MKVWLYIIFHYQTQSGISITGKMYITPSSIGHYHIFSLLTSGSL
jgi:hypothetical protein